MLEAFCDGRVVVKVGDIAAEAVDAIVNAANPALLGGGGVDGAIHAKGGSVITAECVSFRKFKLGGRELPTGEAMITTGGNLPAKHVIHTVGPIYGRHSGREAALLADSYQNSLRLAVLHSLNSIAFPSISCGVYGFPKDEAAAVSSIAIQEFLETDEKITEVRLVFFSTADADLFLEHNKFSAI
jgi:O-acetyl-ADP-ribose deacetylase (regulator of RNase III)